MSDAVAEQQDLTTDSQEARDALALSLLDKQETEATEEPVEPTEESSEGEAKETAPEAVEEAPDGQEEEDQEVEEKPKEKDPRLEKSWSLIMQREKDLRDREKALKDDSKAAQEAQALLERIKADPYSHAEELGLSYDEWTQKILAGETGKSNREIRELSQKVDKILQSKEEDKATAEDKEKAAQAQKAFEAYAGKVYEAADSEEYPFVKLHGAGDDALEYAYLYHQQNPEKPVPNPAEAVKAIEDVLKAQFEKSLETPYGQEMIKKRLEGMQAKQKKPAKKKTETLTNELESQTKRDDGDLTTDSPEARERLIRRLARESN